MFGVFRRAKPSRPEHWASPCSHRTHGGVLPMQKAACAPLSGCRRAPRLVDRSCAGGVRGEHPPFSEAGPRHSSSPTSPSDSSGLLRKFRFPLQPEAKREFPTRSHATLRLGLLAPSRLASRFERKPRVPPCIRSALHETSSAEQKMLFPARLSNLNEVTLPSSMPIDDRSGSVSGGFELFLGV